MTIIKKIFLSLFIVAVFIGILVVLIVMSGLPFGERPTPRSRDAQRKGDITHFQYVLENYYEDNNSYPFNLNELAIDSSERFRQLDRLPTDPKTNSPYEYKLLSGGHNYQLCTNFESSSFIKDQGLKKGEYRYCITSAVEIIEIDKGENFLINLEPNQISDCQWKLKEGYDAEYIQFVDMDHIDIFNLFALKKGATDITFFCRQPLEMPPATQAIPQEDVNRINAILDATEEKVYRIIIK